MLRTNRTASKTWPIAQIDENYRDDEVLEEIFRLGKEVRDLERKKKSE